MKDNVNKNTQDVNEIEYTPERARLPVPQQIELHSEDGNYVKAALDRIGPALDKICQDNHWHIDALKDYFDPLYFPTHQHYSRIINPASGYDRKVKAGQLLELRRVAGISLDRLADGCDPFEFEHMTDAQLIGMMEQISAELSRRIRQR